MAARLATLAALARTAPRASRAVPFRALARPPAPALSALSRAYATHTPDVNPPPSPPSGPALDAALRAAVETELGSLASAIQTASDARASISESTSPFANRYLRALSPPEVEFVNLGQVPTFPEGEVLALLDVSLSVPPFDREKPMAGPDGRGVHVPLLAAVGSTDPAIPCYPLRELFAGLAPRVVRAVHGVLAAQGGEREEGSPLVAVLAPHEGEKREMAIQLAVNLFRLAVQEGNGYQEEIGK